MVPKIKCLKCGSYIHDTERCWNWTERRWCWISKQNKESCDCESCKSKEICQYCNNWPSQCNCSSKSCSVCNEHVKNYHEGEFCRFDHTKPLCKFCKLPIIRKWYVCFNNHHERNALCNECNIPRMYAVRHEHDGSLCKKCGALLNQGKCIYFCTNGGNRCVHCYWEGVVNNVCRNCHKEQTGQLTKAAIK